MPVQRSLGIVTRVEGFEIEDGGYLSSSELYGISLDYIKLRHLPLFRPSEIVVPEEVHEVRVLEVDVEGQQLCRKTIQPRYADIERELAMMQSMLNIRPNLRVPQLKGLVTSETGEQLIGSLMEWMKPHPQILCLKPILGSVRDVPEGRRQKLAHQLRDSLRIIHAKGIHWGDVNPDNLMIDEDDDIWLTDMGGNFAPGWVPEALKDSVAGDREGHVPF